jgi:hypothetical protein
VWNVRLPDITVRHSTLYSPSSRARLSSSTSGTILSDYRMTTDQPPRSTLATRQPSQCHHVHRLTARGACVPQYRHGALASYHPRTVAGSCLEHNRNVNLLGDSRIIMIENVGLVVTSASPCSCLNPDE